MPKKTQAKKVKKKRKPYFGKEVQAAIVYYNEIEGELTNEIAELSSQGLDTSELQLKLSKVPLEKTRLFNTMIYPALAKLCENIIHTWKFYNYETDYLDLKTEAISFLYEQLHKYNPATGSKAYSYFTIVARNFFIKKSQTVAQARKTRDDLDQVDLNRNIDAEITYSDYQEQLKDFTYYWSFWIEKNIDRLFKSKIDKKVAQAIAVIFRTADELDIFNKKMLYVLIREQAMIDNTLHVTRVVKKLKVHFYNMFEDFQKEGKIISPL